MPRTSALLAPTVLSVALVVGLAACTQAAASPPPTTTDVATTAPATTAAPTTAALTTTTPTTTAPPTTTPPTTVAPDPEAVVAADFLRTEAASYLCTEDPHHCDVATFAVPGSPTYTNFEKYVKKLAQADWREATGPTGYVVVESVVIAPNGRTAVLRACQWDDGLTYDPAGTVDPSDDIVVDDTHATRRATFELQLTDGGWRRAVTTIDEKVLGENTCPPPGG